MSVATTEKPKRKRQRRVKRNEAEEAPSGVDPVEDLGAARAAQPRAPKSEPKESSSTRSKREKEEREKREASKAQAASVVSKLITAACGYGTMRAQVAPVPDQQTAALAGSTVLLMDHYGLLETGAHPALIFAVSLGSVLVYVRRAEKIPVEDAVAYYGDGAAKFYETSGDVSDDELAKADSVDPLAGAGPAG